MGVRNCSEIGSNLRKIMNRLYADKDLIKLIYYTDKDPLAKPELTEEQIRTIIYDDYIRVTPRVKPDEKAHPIIVFNVSRGTQNTENSEFQEIRLTIETFIPLEQWIIKNENFRPFLILGEIEKSLKGKSVDGLGTISGGDFELNFLTDEIAAYRQFFFITTYD